MVQFLNLQLWSARTRWKNLKKTTNLSKKFQLSSTSCVLLTPKTISYPQHHCLFRTRCTNNDKICQVIIHNEERQHCFWEVDHQPQKLEDQSTLNPTRLVGSEKGGESRVYEIEQLPPQLATTTKIKLFVMFWTWMHVTFSLGNHGYTTIRSDHSQRQGQHLWIVLDEKESCDTTFGQNRK